MRLEIATNFHDQWSSSLPMVPPLWRQMTKYAPGQISDDTALESLGVGIDRYAGVDVPTLLGSCAGSVGMIR